MLVVAFQVKICLGSIGVERGAGIGVLVAAAQHMPEGGTGVKPDFQNVGALGVQGCIRCAQDLLRRHTAPGFDAALFDDVCRLVQDGHGIGVQFARVLVQKEGHRHAPTALARDAPVGPVGDHVAQACLAVFGVEPGHFDGIERELTQGFRGLVLGEHPVTCVHANKPLGGGTVDDRRLVAPAMGVAVDNWAGGHQVARLLQGGQDHRAGLPDVHATKQRQVLRVLPVALHRVQNVVVAHAVGHATVEVIHAIGRRRVHDAGAVTVTNVVGQVQRGQASVAVRVGA